MSNTFDDQASPVVCTFDLDDPAPGRRTGYLRVPHSVHRSAYGTIPIPVARIRGAEDGPNVFLMAGNHGDEYEGQIVVSDLIRTLDPRQIAGTLTLLPMANFPAAEAGLRTSPLDEGNLNRSFPGTPYGSPTPMIAHMIETVLMPGTDLFLDLHSGGSSMYCLPFAFGVWEEDAGERNALRRTVLDAMRLPAAVMEGPREAPWFATSAAFRAGAVGFTFELGGGGTVDTAIVAGAKAGVLRALKNVGAYSGPTEETALSGKCEEFPGDTILFSEEAGLCELLATSGDIVKAGAPAARIHFPETPGKAPLEVAFATDGLILAHRVPARVLRGDCLFHVAVPG